MKEKLAAVTVKPENFSENCGESFDAQTNHDLLSVMEDRVGEIQQKFPLNSFQRLFWDQQMKATCSRSPFATCWNPIMIKWCIYDCHLSSGRYEALRKSGCIALPSHS